jgi:hypothetical protein
MTVHRRWGLCVAVLFVCQVLASSPAGATTPGEAAHGTTLRLMNGHTVGLGKVLTTADGGQIFGWDIDMHGTDGVLTTSTTVQQGYKVSMETFDQQSATITNVFAQTTGNRHSYLVDGIFAGNLGLVTHYVTPKGTIYPKRLYDLMDPVSAGRFTGSWTPPVKNFDIVQNAENQSTSTSVVYGIELKHQDDPALVVSDLRADTSTLLPLDPDTYGIGHALVAQDTRRNRAVLATSNGAVGGPPPINALVNLKTGKLIQWNGLNYGPFGAGFVNGLAVDSRTGIAATTTELNAQVEFYDLAKRTGTAVQLPGTGPADQLNSGAAVASDSMHKLFLVADPVYAPTGGSAIVVYKENGDFVEAITGFDFSNSFSVVPIRVAVNPALRMGYVDGPGIDQLQQFFY